jgi:hypothetical protein
VTRGAGDESDRDEEGQAVPGDQGAVRGAGACVGDGGERRESGGRAYLSGDGDGDGREHREREHGRGGPALGEHEQGGEQNGERGCDDGRRRGEAVSSVSRFGSLSMAAVPHAAHCR